MPKEIEITLYCVYVIIVAIYSFTLLKKNKRINKLEKIKRTAQILQNIPNYINEAEHLLKDEASTKKWGVTKLEIVLNKIKYDCIKNEVEFNEYEYASEIEKILSTPQKKGVNEIEEKN